MSSETSLPWLVQNKPSAPIRRVETRLNSSKDNIIAKSFRLPTKTRLSIPLNFLFAFVFHRRTINLEMQNFSLENHHIMNARQPFCWWMTFKKVSNMFLPSPPKWLTWPLDVRGGVEYGLFYRFSLYWKNFFPNLSGVRIFSPTYNGVRFCSALYVMSDIFSVQDIFLPGIYLHAFFLSKSVCRTFFLKSLITSSKVKWSVPKIHKTFG